MGNELSKADAIELLEALANGDIDTFDMDPVIAMLREPTYRWRRVEDEKGDGPFLGWGPEWESPQAVRRASYAVIGEDNHVERHEEYWDYVETVLSDMSGAAEGLTHVCDLHLPKLSDQDGEDEALEAGDFA